MAARGRRPGYRIRYQVGDTDRGECGRKRWLAFRRDIGAQGGQYENCTWVRRSRATPEPDGERASRKTNWRALATKASLVYEGKRRIAGPHGGHRAADLQRWPGRCERLLRRHRERNSLLERNPLYGVQEGACTYQSRCRTGLMECQQVRDRRLTGNNHGPVRTAGLRREQQIMSTEI